MKNMETQEVDVLGETRVTSIIATVTVLVVLTLVAIGLNQIAALVAGLGFFAILERLRRLFVLFRSQRRHFACLAIVSIAMCAFAAVCWTVYLGSPLGGRRGS
ncbi:MAG: hypothetical protein NVV68_18520 [Dokdonella sp.]|nr:hypothetical protein [Dokdonella sp.]